MATREWLVISEAPFPPTSKAYRFGGFFWWRNAKHLLTVLGGVLLRLAGVHDQRVQVAALHVRPLLVGLLEHQELGDVQLLDEVARAGG